MKIKLNGREIEAKAGESVLDVSLREGVEIPNLCSYEDHENGVCRLCMVQISNSPKLVPACSTKVTENAEITTESDKIGKYRKSMLSLLMKNHPSHADGSEKKCQLHSYAKKYSVSTVPEVKIVAAPDKSHPAIDFDPSLCVACRRCVIACNQEQNNDVLNMEGRGLQTTITFDAGESFADSSCVSCGLCVDVCPTGALIEKNWVEADRTVVSTCPYCGVGCTVEYGIKGEDIVWARGVTGDTTNKGKLCVKGKFGFEFEMSSDRLLYPLIRREGIPRGPLDGRKVEDVFRKASWDEALSLLTEKIKETKEKFGADAIAGIASDRSTNEDVFAFQKFMRATLGTDNVDQSATLCHSPSAAMLSWALGAGASTNPVHDVFNSKTIMVVGSNTDRAHPVVSSNLKMAAKKGAHLIVVDPRKVELAEKAGTFLQIKPGSDTFLFSAMAKYIVENNLQDTEYVKEKAEGYEEFLKSLEKFDLKTAEKVTGIPSEEIARVARAYATEKPSSIYWTLGITEHVNGSDNVSSLVNLAILTGNIGIPGGGLNPIRGQNNVQGGADVGGTPGSLPGYQNLMDAGVRASFESKWKIELPGHVGLKSTEMTEKALSGPLKLMYISGENSIRSHPNSMEVAEALKKLNFLAVQDIFLTETAEFADMILPAATSFEKTGTFTNTERKVQMVRPLFDPPGEARQDWEIYSELSDRLGYDMGFKNTGEIMTEISQLVPKWKGISHTRLEKAGLPWPVPSLESEGTEILHVNGASRGKARFRPLGWERTEDMRYPYVLITGRKREQYHTATMTSRSRVISEITQGPYIEMNPQDMNREGVRDDEPVEVVSETGKITARVISSNNLPEGVTFTTFHYTELRANVLTPSVLDPLTKTPAYKDTRIKIVKR